MRNDYKKNYLQEFRYLSKIDDLTLQDVRGAMELMFNKGLLTRSKFSEFSKQQYEQLFRLLQDTANPYNKIPEAFKQAVSQTRYDRTHRPKKQPVQEPEEKIEYRSPDEDMEAMSKALLYQDDVSYDGRSDESAGFPTESELFDNFISQDPILRQRR